MNTEHMAAGQGVERPPKIGVPPEVRDGANFRSMPADRKDLEARIAAANQEDTVRGLIFNAVFSVVREALGEQAARACDPCGKGTRVDFFTYPVVDFLRVCWAAAEKVEPVLRGTDPVFFRIGHRACTFVFGSLLGRTLLALSRAGGPRQLLLNAPGAYRGTVSYGERTAETVSDRHVRLTFRRDFLVPPFHCGVFVAAIEAVGGRRARAEGRQTGLLDATYDVTWEA
jgi:uncharacterized protein (TIGR02265 family)